MKQLPDFDLSIVMPFYKRLDEFKRVFPSKAKYYERNGIEVVIVADEPTEEQGILDISEGIPLSTGKSWSTTRIIPGEIRRKHSMSASDRLRNRIFW